ncbi:MAG: metallophosphoesterase [Clostridia bacterium]|nr:metallophosphoesterase [Clostridia bacterium]
MNNIGSFFLSVLVSYGKFISLLVHPKAPADTGEFTPVIRFLATSDGHITTIGDVQTTRLEKMIKMGNRIARSDKEYSRLDAVIVAGDITDMGTKIAYGSIKAALAPVLKKDTEFLATVSTSHDDRKLGKASLELYRNIMGQETDFHRVINGFHFVGVSASETLKENYDDKQKNWLREQLDAAVADDPSKPVFVFQHEHIKDTVYGSYESEGWGMPDLADVIKKYPQVVDFSGHSHYPINDARSIWQGEYTALGTGGLYYAELTVDDIKTVHPKRYRSVSTFWVVEVDKNNRIRLRAADLKSQQYLCEYILEGPLAREYTPEKQLERSLPPVFRKETRIKTGKDSVTFDSAESSDGMPVFIYRAFAVNASGERIPAGKTVAPYYMYKVPEKVKIKFDNLPAGTEKIEIVAENCYGIQSEPVTIGLN